MSSKWSRISFRLPDSEADEAIFIGIWPAGTIRASELPVLNGPSTASETKRVGSDGRPLSLADLERDHIATVLRQTSWHQGRAAEALGISPKTLYRKIREYGFKRA